VASDATWLDSMPAAYDELLGPALFEPYAQELARRASALQPGRVLELAAGTGIVTRALLAALPGAEIVATDLNPPMVAWAAARAPRATWRQADAQALAEESTSYDLVVCSFGAMFFPDKPAAFAEVARVLRPGGTFLAAIWDVVEDNDLGVALMAALTAVLPDQTPDFVVRIPHGYGDPDRIRGDVETGGLQVQAIERVLLRGTAASARDAADGYCLGSPLRFGLTERGDLAELRMQIGAEMEKRLGTGPVEGGLSAYIVTARRPS
jgi:SAM-dependent methyltransferase